METETAMANGTVRQYSRSPWLERCHLLSEQLYDGLREELREEPDPRRREVLQASIQGTRRVRRRVARLRGLKAGDWR